MIDSARPPFQQGVSTAYLTLMFCLPFCGTAELFLFLGIGQLVFTWIVWSRWDVLSLLVWSKRQHPLLFIVFITWLTLSCLSLFKVLWFMEVTALQRMAAVLRHLYLLLQLAYCLALIQFIRCAYVSGKAIFVALLAGVCGMVCLQALIFHWGPVPDSWGWFFHPPLAGHIRDIGNLAAVVCMPALVLVLQQSRYRYVCFVAFWLVWTFLFWSGGRTAIVASILLSIALIAMFNYWRVALRYRSMCALLLMLVALFSAESLKVFDWNGLARTTETLVQITQTQPVPANTISSGRTGMWQMSFNALQDDWLLGLGPYGYFFIPERVYGDQPHNLFMQFLIEWGVLGTAAVLLLMLAVALMVWRHRPSLYGEGNSEEGNIESNQAYIISAAVIVLLTLVGLTSGTYFNYQPVFCLVSAYAILLGSSLKAETKTAA